MCGRDTTGPLPERAEALKNEGNCAVFEKKDTLAIGCFDRVSDHPAQSQLNVGPLTMLM